MAEAAAPPSRGAGLRRAGILLIRLSELGTYLLLGLVFAGVTWQKAELRWTLERHGRVTEATVIGHEGVSRWGDPTFRPILSFTTAAGHRVLATAKDVRQPGTRRWPRGERIAVVHDPAAPARVVTVAELGRVGWVEALLPGVGASLLVWGLFALRLRACLRAARR